MIRNKLAYFSVINKGPRVTIYGNVNEICFVILLSTDKTERGLR